MEQTVQPTDLTNILVPITDELKWWNRNGRNGL